MELRYSLFLSLLFAKMAAEGKDHLGIRAILIQAATRSPGELFFFMAQPHKGQPQFSMTNYTQSICLALLKSHTAREASRGFRKLGVAMSVCSLVYSRMCCLIVFHHALLNLQKKQ